MTPQRKNNSFGSSAMPIFDHLSNLETLIPKDIKILYISQRGGK